jgi:threonine/homoserine/homoserine lactone efflux protein
VELFLKGLLAGFIIAVPLGPVSVLCFRRVLVENRIIGLFTVFGAAAADMIYGLVAALGITAIMHLILSHREALHVFGGVFLLVFGLYMIRSHPNEKEGKQGDDPHTLGSAFLSAFGLMIANPVIVISFLGVLAALDLSAHHAGVLEACWLGAGMFIGSSSWWIVYKAADCFYGEQLRRNGIHLINLSAGLLVCAFGLWQLGVAIIRHP